MAAIIGIDLGTSTTEVSVYRDGKPVLLPDGDGCFITPSVVGLDEEERIIVGRKAEEQYLLYPEKTAVEVKRMMGSGQNVYLGKSEYTPAEISAEIISWAKSYAQDYLGEEINRAVITVPAYFTNDQRNETIEAGALAGLKVERIINEPTAAALCYGIDHMEEESHILVYDFGGGTFDVTLLEMFEGVLEVKAASGDNCLGGKDFDEKLIQYFLGICRDKYGVDLRDDVYAMVKLKDSAVKCKIALSTQDSWELVLPLIAQKDGNPISLQETVTVEVFEELIGELVERTKKAVDVVLKDGNIAADQVDKVLLVGGSTRVPCVKRYVAALFGKEPEESVDPDLAVALGAGIQSGILDGKINTQSGIMITDVAPYALGVRTAVDMGMYLDNNCFDILIPRNLTIPVTKKKRYYTGVPYQRECEIEVYQGEEARATDNIFLGKFLLSGIPPRPDCEAVEVEFSYDLNGVLKVTGKIVSTGREASITIETAKAVMEAEDLENWRKSPVAKKFRSSIRKAEKLLEGNLEEEDKEDLKELLQELKRGLIREADQTVLENLEEELNDLMDFV